MEAVPEQEPIDVDVNNETGVIRIVQTCHSIDDQIIVVHVSNVPMLIKALLKVVRDYKAET